MFTNGEKPNGKNPTRWFSSHHSQNSIIITTNGYKQGITSTLPIYSWILTPIPKQTCSIVIVSLSDAWLPSTWLTVARIPVRDFKTPIWKDCWLQNSSVYPHNEDQEDAWSQNPAVQIHSNFFKRKRWTRSRTLSLVTICLNRVCLMFMQLVYRLTTLNFICLGLGEKKAHRQIHRSQENHSWNLKFLNLDR